MKFMVLCSSSSGNCTYLESEGKKYLLDCGASLRQIYAKIKERNIFLDELNGIFITHEHSDHISGIVSVASHYNCPIYVSKLTYRALPDTVKEKISPIRFVFFKPEAEFPVYDLSIFPFRTSHDAIDPVGFRITDKSGKILVYLTDTGCFTPNEGLKNASAYIIESNHEPEVLLMSERPWVLKNRIMSDLGHLSNEASAELFNELKGENTKLLVLFHLSDECNTKELALTAFESYARVHGLSMDGYHIIVSDKTEPTELLEVN